MSPWVISDMALAFRPGAAPPFALRHLTTFVGLTFIFLAGPAVLAAFFWRSAPKHDPWLTVLACGLPLVLVLFAGAVSLLRMVGAMRGGASLQGRRRWLAKGAGGVVTLAMAVGVLGLGWARSSDDWSSLGAADFTTGLLARADLQGVVFTETPPGWLPRDEAFAAFLPPRDVPRRRVQPRGLWRGARVPLLRHRRPRRGRSGAAPRHLRAAAPARQRRPARPLHRAFRRLRGPGVPGMEDET